MISDQHDDVCISHISLVDGSVANVFIRDGLISTVQPDSATANSPEPSARLDLQGYILLPAPAEPHAHLDKALLGSRVTNESEDLVGAITAVIEAYRLMTEDDIADRALRAIRQAVAHGYTAIRTHLDCRVGVGSRSVAVLQSLRQELREFIDLQLVALAGPVAGEDGAGHRALLEESLEAGADLVGGVPTLEEDSEASVRELLAVASSYGVGVDLHVDETLDSDARALRILADRVIETGFAAPVTASHCVSLASQPLADIQDTARRVHDAGIRVVALPQTNLYLQGRELSHTAPRGITAVRELRDAGVLVASGGDNWRDPFNPMGRIDAMETASLLVSAGHQRVADAYESVSAAARALMGLPETRIAPGYPANLLAIRGDNLADAVGRASEDRVVISRGRIIARTQTITEFGAGALTKAPQSPR